MKLGSWVGRSWRGEAEAEQGKRVLGLMLVLTHETARAGRNGLTCIPSSSWRRVLQSICPDWWRTRNVLSVVFWVCTCNGAFNPDQHFSAVFHFFPSWLTVGCYLFPIVTEELRLYLGCCSWSEQLHKVYERRWGLEISNQKGGSTALLNSLQKKFRFSTLLQAFKKEAGNYACLSVLIHLYLDK